MLKKFHLAAVRGLRGGYFQSWFHNKSYNAFCKKSLMI